MLVLSRKLNESIIVNGDIRVEVLQIKGKQIRLGITAPSSVKVLRGELAQAGKEPGESRRESECCSRKLEFAPRETPAAATLLSA